jgi:hypothetical protein
MGFLPVILMGDNSCTLSYLVLYCLVLPCLILSLDKSLPKNDPSKVNQM